MLFRYFVSKFLKNTKKMPFFKIYAELFIETRHRIFLTSYVYTINNVAPMRFAGQKESTRGHFSDKISAQQSPRHHEKIKSAPKNHAK